MRYLTPVLIVLLLISVIANGVLYLKFRSHRPIVTVNNTSLSKYELDVHLEMFYGPEYKATFVRRALFHDAAEKAKLSPSEIEVNDRFQEQKQTSWQFAATVNNNPWLADEYRKAIREKIEIDRVRAKDLPVTADEMRDEYNLQPAAYDTPSKAEAEVALLKPGTHTEDIVRLISTGNVAAGEPTVKPAAIINNYRGEVKFLGDNNVYTFVRRLGTQDQPLPFSMKPGEVKMVPPTAIPPEFRSAGYTGMVIRLMKLLPGRQADLTDPNKPPTDPREKDFKKTQELLRLTVALKRANPAQEVLRSLYQSAKIEVEEPIDAENIKLKLFPPDEAAQPGTPAKQAK